MQFEYQDEKVRKILCDAKVLQRKVRLEIGRKVKKRMNELESAENFNLYLTQVGLGKPHPLTGKYGPDKGLHPLQTRTHGTLPLVSPP